MGKLTSVEVVRSDMEKRCHGSPDPAAGVVVRRRRGQIRTQPVFVQSRRVGDGQARAELWMARSSLDTIEGLERLCGEDVGWRCP